MGDLLMLESEWRMHAVRAQMKMMCDSWAYQAAERNKIPPTPPPFDAPNWPHLDRIYQWDRAYHSATGHRPILES